MESHEAEDEGTERSHINKIVRFLHYNRWKLFDHVEFAEARKTDFDHKYRPTVIFFLLSENDE